MLLKLIKHEIRSTFKQMWPVFVGMLALTVLCRFVAFPILDRSDSFLLNVFSILLVMIFFICLFVLAFMPLLISTFRFKKSILQDEGYLTMTLPVSSHQLIISKLIVNAIWYGITGILMMIILTLLVSDSNSVEIFGPDLSFIKNDIKSVYHFTVCGIELLVNYVVLISLGTLIIYAEER